VAELHNIVGYSSIFFYLCSVDMGYGYRRTEIGVSVGFTTEFFPWICYIWVDKSVIEGWFVLHLDGAVCASGGQLAYDVDRKSCFTDASHRNDPWSAQIQECNVASTNL